MNCQYCGKECKNVKQHERLCKLNPNHVDLSYLSSNALITNQKRKGKHKIEYKDYDIVCPNCGKHHIEYISINNYKKGKYKKFCCASCANKRCHSEETKQKISKTLSENFANTLSQQKINTDKVIQEKQKIKIYKELTCKICNNKYYKNNLYPNSTNMCCSLECRQYYLLHRKDFLSKNTLLALSNAGKKSSQLQFEVRRSKNEKMFCELCEKYFNNVEHNISLFNGWDADVIIHDIKYAILWNGKWHYEQIAKKHSVKQVQNRDKIKIQEIQNYGYIPYIIKDMGKYNPDFVNKQFEIFLNYIKNNMASV